MAVIRSLKRRLLYQAAAPVNASQVEKDKLIHRLIFLVLYYHSPSPSAGFRNGIGRRGVRDKVRVPFGTNADFAHRKAPAEFDQPALRLERAWGGPAERSEEHTSELQARFGISY